MNRRELGLALGLSAVAAAAGATPVFGTDPRPKVAMLVHPDMVLIDLIGPQTVLSLAMAEIHLVWRNRDPVTTDVGIPITPTTTFADCPVDLDVLFVPGGLRGSVALMDDAEALDFLADRGARATHVTSVCTGGLVLAAAGLLRGYRATAHWYVRELLALMGATVEPARVVVDGNRVTGAGVTAGIDFALRLSALMRGEDVARRIGLIIEYDPEPPFESGTPAKAGAAMTDDVLARRAPLIAAARAAAERARTRLRI